MGVHKGQCPRITGRKQCRGTLFPASITGKSVHSFLPVNIGKRRVQGYTLSCQLIVGREECRGTLFPVLVIVGRAIVWGYTLAS